MRPRGPGAAWAGEKPRKADEFVAGLSHSILLVEVARSDISWTEPRDLSLNTLGGGESKSAPLSVSSNHGHNEEFFFAFDKVVPSVHVAMGDGSTDFLRLGRLSTEELRKILQIGARTIESCVSLEARLDEGRRPNWPNIAALAVWLLSAGTLLVGAVRGRKPRSVSLVPSPPN